MLSKLKFKKLKPAVEFDKMNAALAHLLKNAK